MACCPFIVSTIMNNNNNNSNNKYKPCQDFKEVLRHPKYLDFYKAVFVIQDYEGRQFNVNEFIELFNHYLELF